MPIVVTKVVKYIGGDYTSIQAALDATPASLVSTDEQWDILIDESASGNLGWSSGTALSVPARTTDATRYIRIKANTGKSFRDHTNKLINALRYNAANGVGIQITSSFTEAIQLGAQFTRVEGLQFLGDAGSDSQDVYSAIAVNASNCTVRDCIAALRATATGARRAINNNGAANTLIVNSLLHAAIGLNCEGAGSPSITMRNCTLVYSAGASSGRIGINADFTPVTAINCAVLGFTDGVYASQGGTTLQSASNYNATNGSAPTNWGVNSLNGLTAADQIESTTTSSIDARAKAVGSLDSAGTRDLANTADLDIVGRARSTSTPTIGAWEVIATTPVLSLPSVTDIGATSVRPRVTLTF